MTPAAMPDGPPSRKALSIPYCRLFRPYTFIVRPLAALHAGTDSEKPVPLSDQHSNKKLTVCQCGIPEVQKAAGSG